MVRRRWSHGLVGHIIKVFTTDSSGLRANRQGIETVSATVISRSKHGMIPGVKPWTLKLVFDRKNPESCRGTDHF